ncbi:DegT/DnrJ/EryC1/StrS family aminotransferase [Paraglaciecola polaris]|uniref:DegT/DnrJ/EryC1/StrS family aminotransferase n=1 Tax=Paraglaciecola polaris TaxID=222814 RepID=UPI0030EC42EF|tara:strand:- start:3205 stop:4350 length:1146 start_codon:yes stop_codon:yes gene_type:complete
MSHSLPLFGVVSTTDMEQIAIKILRSGQIASGPYVDMFEAGFASLIDCHYALAINDMTNAIHLALRLAKVEAGDEVITTSFSCMASNSPIALCGASPVWVDIKENSVEVDPILFEAAITSKTKAAIIYHVAGYASQIDEIADICKRYNIKLIEDCNNSLLATLNGKNLGSFGDYSIFSFYPNRQINCTEGAMLICKDKGDYKLGKQLRRLGIDFSIFRNEIGEIDPNADIPIANSAMSLNNLCSALGYMQLKNVKSRLEKSKNNANFYRTALMALPTVKIVSTLVNSEAAHWVFLVQVKNRDEIISFMKNNGVNVSSLHQRNDVYSCFNAEPKKNIPNTVFLQETILALPCGWWLSSADVQLIVEVLRKAILITRSTPSLI